MKTGRAATIREVWMAVGQDGFSLCSFCKHGESHGRCEDFYVECLHPLQAVLDGSQDVQFGADCWGFRPRFDRDTCLDIIGATLDPKAEGWHLNAAREATEGAAKP